MDDKPKKRGRPRKNIEKQRKIDQKKADDDENIVLYLALSDDDKIGLSDNVPKYSASSLTISEDADANTNNNNINKINTNDYSSDSSSDSVKKFNPNLLIEEIKKRDKIINNLKNKKNITFNKTNNINYHCTILADNNTGEIFKPYNTGICCWWCDNSEFNTLPVYMPNHKKNNIYFIFGYFCSFECACIYNFVVLNDYKCHTRYALLNEMKFKITGSNSPIKFAPARELLRSKGGPLSIDEYRSGFTLIDLHMSMPPMIQFVPLVHSIEEIYRDS